VFKSVFKRLRIIIEKAFQSLHDAVVRKDGQRNEVQVLLLINIRVERCHGGIRPPESGLTLLVNASSCKVALVEVARSNTKCNVANGKEKNRDRPDSVGRMQLWHLATPL